MGRRVGCPGRPRNPAHRERILAGFGSQLDKPRVRTQEGVPLPIGLYSLCRINRIEDGGGLFEALAAQPVEPEAAPHQQGAIGSIAKGRLVGKRKPLRRPKGLKPLTVVAEDAVFRAHPEEARAVLVNLQNCQVAKPFSIPQCAKTVFLGIQCLADKQQ